MKSVFLSVAFPDRQCALCLIDVSPRGVLHQAPDEKNDQENKTEALDSLCPFQKDAVGQKHPCKRLTPFSSSIFAPIFLLLQRYFEPEMVEHLIT